MKAVLGETISKLISLQLGILRHRVLYRGHLRRPHPPRQETSCRRWRARRSQTLQDNFIRTLRLLLGLLCHDLRHGSLWCYWARILRSKSHSRRNDSVQASHSGHLVVIKLKEAQTYKQTFLTSYTLTLQCQAGLQMSRSWSLTFPPSLSPHCYNTSGQVSQFWREWGGKLEIQECDSLPHPVRLGPRWVSCYSNSIVISIFRWWELGDKDLFCSDFKSMFLHYSYHYLKINFCLEDE